MGLLLRQVIGGWVELQDAVLSLSYRTLLLSLNQKHRNKNTNQELEEEEEETVIGKGLSNWLLSVRERSLASRQRNRLRRNCK